MRENPKPLAGVRDQIGKLVRVKHCIGAYRLPADLPEGATVKILGFDHGYYDVEYDGRVFQINMTCITGT